MMAMMTSVRGWLFLRGWVACDQAGCRKVIRPRWLALRQGWRCGGVAGAYDTCPEHVEAVWR